MVVRNSTGNYTYDDLHLSRRLPMAEKRKLTLSIDEDVIRRAKALARRWDTSVSAVVEQGLRGLAERSSGEERGTGGSLVARLRGVLPEDAGRDAYRRHLEEKHGG